MPPETEQEKTSSAGDSFLTQLNIFPWALACWLTLVPDARRGIYLWPPLMFICVSGTSSCPPSAPHSFRSKPPATVLVLESDSARGRVFIYLFIYFQPSVAAHQDRPARFWGDGEHRLRTFRWAPFLAPTAMGQGILGIIIIAVVVSGLFFFNPCVPIPGQPKTVQSELSHFGLTKAVRLGFHQGRR